MYNAVEVHLELAHVVREVALANADEPSDAQPLLPEGGLFAGRHPLRELLVAREDRRGERGVHPRERSGAPSRGSASRPASRP